MSKHGHHHQRREHDERSGLVGGAILVALGMTFLFQRTIHLDFNIVGLAWPFFIIGPGLLLFTLMILGGRGAGSLAIPASVVTTIGLILLGQSIFDYYESWAYVWALIPTAVGVGMAIGGFWDGKRQLVRVGLGMVSGGLTMFLIFGSFFELFIFGRGHLGAYVWPVVLIAVGLALLLGRSRSRATSDDTWHDDDPTPVRPQDEGRVFPY